MRTTFWMGLATMAFAGATADAQEACSSPPPNPPGHIVARIARAVDVSEGGKQRARVTLDKGSAATIEVGDDVHVIDCRGNALNTANNMYFADIDSVSTGQSLTVLEGFKVSSLTNAYVAIDVGMDSPPPASAGVPRGWLGTRVLSASVLDSRIRIILAVGSKHGVLPGDKGYFLKAQGGHGIDLEIETITRITSFAWITGANLDAVKATPFVALNTNRTCSLSTAPATPTDATPRPPGFSSARIKSTRPFGDDVQIEIDQGAPQVLPGSKVIAELPNIKPSAWPMGVVSSVTKTSARAVIALPPKVTSNYLTVASFAPSSCK